MAHVDLRDLDTDDRLRSLDEGHCRRQRGNARTLAQRLVTKPSAAVPDSPNTEVDLARIKSPGSIGTMSAIHAPGFGLFCCAERSCLWRRMESFGANPDQELRLLGPSPTASGSVPTPM